MYSAETPSYTQRQQLISFLEKKYNSDVILTWKEDRELSNGFRIEVGRVDGDDHTSNWKLDSVYDWSLKGRLKQLKEEIRQLTTESGNIIPLMKETIKNWTPKALEQEIGTVLSVGDGIATISGLSNVTYREIVIFPLVCEEWLWN